MPTKSLIYKFKFFPLLISFIFLISIPDILYYCLNRRYGTAFLCFCVDLGLFCSLAFVFQRWLKIYLYLLLPVVFLAVVNVFCVVLYNVPLNYDIFLLALNTNLNEASELLRWYVGYFVICLALYGVVCFYIIKYMPRAIPLKNALVTLVIGLVMLLSQAMFKSEKGNNMVFLKIATINAYPGTIYYALNMVAHHVSLIQHHQLMVKKFKFNAFQQHSVGTKQIYVMIIGESSRYDHWGVNGYLRPTSPQLSKRSNLLSFNNMVTGGYITELSVPMLITRAAAENYKQHYAEKSIVSAFKEAGFKTYWISSQVDFGDITMHAKEADKTIWLSSDYKATKGVYQDMALINEFKKVLSFNQQKVFIVIHTLGSHYDYDARYPEKYNVFEPSSKGAYISPTDYSKRDLIINSYDNSIFYTDSVIDSAISLVQHQKACAWLTYISDHGENLFDDKKLLSQHGYPEPSKYVAHIPWFLWTSNAYDSLFPERVSILRQNKASTLGSQNVFYTMSELGDITFAGQDLTKSAASIMFKPQPQLILGGNEKVFNYKDVK